MLKTSDAVQEIVLASDIPLEALRAGILNLSAYAQQIQSNVEEKTMKTVKVNTIIVALSRLRPALVASTPIRPQVVIEQLSIQPALIGISYEKTQQNLSGLARLTSSTFASSFLTFTEGIHEITIITSLSEVDHITDCFESRPKALVGDLVGVSVRFSEKYLREPNLIYAILAMIAVKRINLVEIVSTYTELTMVIEKKNVEATVEALQVYLSK